MAEVAGTDTELSPDVRHVVLDRVEAGAAAPRDGGTAEAMPDQVEDLPLGGREDVGMRGAPASSTRGHVGSLREPIPIYPTHVDAVRLILRLEAVAIFAAGVVAYLQLNGHPLWLLPLLLAPDLSMLGYLGGPRLGAVTYNLAHNLATALIVIGIGWFAAVAPLALAGCILAAHVGMDRSLGYGLKLPTDFRDTHLGRIGR